ncbi:hypothetical protein RND81_02G171300 [Saponaria officinalis]|uniref:Glutaredoxin domain-containing protein n=1 Tax=Saponaria officinalis TaxID=3572 RepID=A0AAW1MVB1_SAPOF
MEVVNYLVNHPVVVFTKSSCCMSHSVVQLISSYGANTTVYQLEDLPNGQKVEKALQRLGLSPSVPAEMISLQVQGRLTPMLK